MEKTPDSNSESSVDSSRPPHWCSICSLDLQSDKALAQHSTGKKHQNRLAALSDGPSSLQTSRGIRCPSCKLFFETHAQWKRHNLAVHDNSSWFCCDVCDEKFSSYRAYEYHRNTSLDAPHLKAIYQRQGIKVDENALEEISAFPATAPEMQKDNHDVDYSQIDDVPRMLQTEYDDAVVELALYNYESFHSLMAGSATFSMVSATSAGIQGWSTFGDVKPPGDEKEIKDSKTKEGVQQNTNVSSHRKGDSEEEQLIRIAMMESLLESRGVRPASCHEESKGDDQSQRHDASIYLSDIEEEFSYQYESDAESDDDYESQSETSHSHSDGESWLDVSDSEAQNQPDAEMNESDSAFSLGEWNIIN